jgi:hypothetical protein
MSNDKTGGPAFPMGNGAKKIGDVSSIEPDAPGMTLRDYFAGQALVPVVAAADLSSWPAASSDQAVAAIANVSYQIADAMLAERAKVS